jgi:hypothetical protein
VSCLQVIHRLADLCDPRLKDKKGIHIPYVPLISSKLRAYAEVSRAARANVSHRFHLALHPQGIGHTSALPSVAS